MIQQRVEDYAKELRTFRLSAEFKNNINVYTDILHIHTCMYMQCTYTVAHRSVVTTVTDIQDKPLYSHLCYQCDTHTQYTLWSPRVLLTPPQPDPHSHPECPVNGIELLSLPGR